VEDVFMATTVPLSDLSRRTTEVTALLADGDVILGRRDAADLYLSTVERHDREVRGLQVTTQALAALAAVRPDLAGDALMQALPWMVWLPIGEKIKCLEELLGDLRAGAETHELRPFFLGLAAWQSTAVAWADPDVAQALEDVDDHDALSLEESVIQRPGA
jgi:hypothetical protein